MQSDIYRGACRRDGVKRAHCTRGALSSRKFIDLSLSSVFALRVSPVNRDDPEGRGRGSAAVVLMENRSRLCGSCVLSRRDVIPLARARSLRGVNTSESAQHYCRINGKDCLFNRVTGSSASTDLN